MVTDISRWREVPLAPLLAEGGGGWTYDDQATAQRLAASLRRYGQLRPVVVRTRRDGTQAIVDGRRLAAAMLACGMDRAVVVDLGMVDDADAVRVSLALEVRFETDYARLAAAVASLVDGGAQPAELAGISPFSVERITYFGELLRFDWSAFAPSRDGQSRMEWDEDVVLTEPAEGQDDDGPVAPLPAEPSSPQVQAEVEQVLEHATPAEVVAAVKATVRSRRRASAEPSLFGDEEV